MSQKMIVFDADSLLRLLTHYTSLNADRVPLDAELLEAGVSQYLQRYIGLQVRSAQWERPCMVGTNEVEPLHVRYEGRKVMTWGQGGEAYDFTKEGEVEAPR